MSKRKKDLSLGKFIGIIVGFGFWFILSWIIASIIPLDINSLDNFGWQITSAFLNVLMTIVMIVFLVTLIKFIVQFLIDSFSFSKKNWGGKILLPILGIIMILATIVIFALTLGWLIIMFKEVLFNFNSPANVDGFKWWLTNQLTGKYMFLSTSGTLLPTLIPNNSLNSTFPMYVTVFVFLLIWSASGIIYSIFSKALTKKTESQDNSQL